MAHVAKSAADALLNNCEGGKAARRATHPDRNPVVVVVVVAVVVVVVVDLQSNEILFNTSIAEPRSLISRIVASLNQNEVETLVCLGRAVAFQSPAATTIT